jgi:hypothetical protein
VYDKDQWQHAPKTLALLPQNTCLAGPSPKKEKKRKGLEKDCFDTGKNNPNQQNGKWLCPPWTAELLSLLPIKHSPKTMPTNDRSEALCTPDSKLSGTKRLRPQHSSTLMFQSC